MANAVILILVIGYCLFLIYKQVQNRKPENISAVQAVAVPAAVAAAAARAGQKETRKSTDRRKAAVTKTVRSEARGSFLCAKKRGKMGNVGNTTGSMLYGFGAFLVIYLAGVLIYQVVLWIQKWKRKKKDGEQENG